MASPAKKAEARTARVASKPKAKRSLSLHTWLAHAVAVHNSVLRYKSDDTHYMRRCALAYEARAQVLRRWADQGEERCSIIHAN